MVEPCTAASRAAACRRSGLPGASSRGSSLAGRSVPVAPSCLNVLPALVTVGADDVACTRAHRHCCSLPSQYRRCTLRCCFSFPCQRKFSRSCIGRGRAPSVLQVLPGKPGKIGPSDVQGFEAHESNTMHGAGVKTLLECELWSNLCTVQGRARYWGGHEAQQNEGRVKTWVCAADGRSGGEGQIQ